MDSLAPLALIGMLLTRSTAQKGPPACPAITAIDDLRFLPATLSTLRHSRSRGSRWQRGLREVLHLRPVRRATQLHAPTIDQWPATCICRRGCTVACALDYAS